MNFLPAEKKLSLIMNDTASMDEKLMETLPTGQPRFFTKWSDYQLIPEVDMNQLIIKAPTLNQSSSQQSFACCSWCVLHHKCVASQNGSPSSVRSVLDVSSNEDAFTCKLFLRGDSPVKFSYRKYDGMVSFLTTLNLIVQN